MEPIVDIVDVFPTAQRIPWNDLKVGDGVWDVFGGEYTVTKVRVFKKHVRATRSDGAVFYLDEGETITVRRAP